MELFCLIQETLHERKVQVIPTSIVPPCSSITPIIIFLQWGEKLEGKIEGQLFLNNLKIVDVEIIIFLSHPNILLQKVIVILCGGEGEDIWIFLACPDIFPYMLFEHDI